MEFLKNTTSLENMKENKSINNQEILKEQKREIEILIKKLFTSDEFRNLMSAKLEKIESVEKLNDVSFNLEKIYSGLSALANHDFSIENDIESLSEKAKIQENIIRGFHFIKNLFEINETLSIEKRLTFIIKNYAN